MATSLNQIDPVQIGLENLCVCILGLKGLALIACLHHGLSRKCFCYRQLHRWLRAVK